MKSELVALGVFYAILIVMLAALVFASIQK